MSAFGKDLLDWYAVHHRDLPFRQTKDPYKIWVSEIMAQQTRIEAMLGHYERFITLFPDMESLANAPEEQLHKAWEGLGYYSRARNLQKAARICMDQHGGKLPATYGQLLTLPGIGPYTAGAIASIAYGLPEPAVDGNVCRVFARVHDLHFDVLSPKGKREITALARQAMTPPYSDFTQAVMELGALVCIPGNPRCESCPVRSHCKAKDPGSLPVLPPKKGRKTEHRKFLIRTDGKGICLVKRPDTGLLAGLYGFEEVDTFPDGAILLEPHTHTFTHVEWNMEGALLYDGTCNCLTFEETERDFALPSAFRPFYDQVKERILHERTTRD